MSTNSKNLKGTWSQAIGTFLFPLLLVFAVRWLIFEPFVIPSGSMIPNLLIHDHIIVKKYSLGLKIPFTDYWLARWRDPQRGEVLVFRFPENPEVFYIKRLIGLPGDTVEVNEGHIKVNGQEWKLSEEHPGDAEPSFQYYNEDSGENRHIVRFYSSHFMAESPQVFKVPQGQYFFMGDNRDQSSDGRVWGFVPEKYLVGPASFVWLSCENMLTSISYICDPVQIRWKRIFNSVR